MNMQGRSEALEARHRSLEDRIFEEDHRPAPDAAELAKLKGEKLKLKDELERLKGAVPKEGARKPDGKS